MKWRWFRTFEVVFYSLFSVAMVAAIIWVRIATIKTTYAYFQKEKEYRAIQEEIQSLKVKWLRLTTPSKLEKLALKFSLSAPAPNQVTRYSAADEEE